MSELGSGGGSSYPGAIDTDNTLEVDSPNAGKTKARAAVPNDLAAAIIAIQTELGTDPAGSVTDVKTFLQTEHAANGTHTTDVIAEKTADTGVTVDGCLIKDGGVDAVKGQESAQVYKRTHKNIGVWDMATDQSVVVAHGLTLADIRTVKVMILSDANDLYSFPSYGAGGTTPEWAVADATNVTIYRSDSGNFDHTDFNDGTNRGYITIWHV